MKTYTAHVMRDWSVLMAQMKTLLMEYATEKVCHLYQVDYSIMQLITCNDIRVVHFDKNCAVSADYSGIDFVYHTSYTFCVT